MSAARAFGGIFAALALLPTTSARAANVGDGLKRCAAISAADARLACYDALVGRPVEAAPSAAAATAASAAPGHDATSFGTPVPSQSQLAERRPAPEVVDSIQAHITKVTTDGGGKTWLTLDNGQVWTTTDGDGRVGAGDLVTLRRSALGSYMMTTASRHSYHISRAK